MVVLLEGGPPQRWEPGTKISMEGRLVSSGSGDYLLNGSIAKSGHPEMTYRYCALLRFPPGRSFVLWKARAIAGRDWKVTATGMSNEKNPTYPVLGTGLETHGRCALDIHVERLSIE